MNELNKEWGYTRKFGERRPLTESEHQQLEEIRRKVVDQSEVYIEKNLERFSKFLRREESPKDGWRNRHVTVTFDEDSEWARFTDWLFDEYRGAGGIEFSDVPIERSIRVSPSLLRSSIDKFRLRPPLKHDFEKYAEKTVSPYGFDAANLEGRHVTGLGHFKERKRGK